MGRHADAFTPRRQWVSIVAGVTVIFALENRSFPKVWKIFISLSISDLQKELCRILQNFALSRNAKLKCSNFASENSNEMWEMSCHPEGKLKAQSLITKTLNTNMILLNHKSHEWTRSIFFVNMNLNVKRSSLAAGKSNLNMFWHTLRLCCLRDDLISHR